VSMKDTAAHTPQDDVDIRSLYRANRRRVDVEGFVSTLDVRLAGAGKRARRRPAVRRIAIALAAVVLAAGVSIGTWQAAVHLGDGPESILVIGDPAEPAENSGGSSVAPGLEAFYPDFLTRQPRSVSELEFVQIWREAAATLDVAPRGARLDSIQISWDQDGLLESFYLSASTPDGRTVDLSAYVGGPALDPKSDHVTFTGAAVAHGGSSAYGSMSWGPAADAMTPSVDHVLAALDSVGLMETAVQAFGPTARLDRVLWSLSSLGTTPINEIQQLTAVWGVDASLPTTLSLSGGRVDRVDDAASLSALFPAFGLSLGRQWLNESTSGSGSLHMEMPEALVLLPVSTVQEKVGSDTGKPRPVGAQLDGLAFATWRAEICRVREGLVETVWRPNEQYQLWEGSHGVSYSSRRTWLLHGAGIVLVTPSGSGEPFEVFVGNASPGSGSSDDGTVEPWSGTGQAAIMAHPASGPGEPLELFRYFAPPLMNRIRYDETNDQIWLTMMSQDPDQITLLTARPHDSELLPIDPPLGRSFGGDFAVSPDASTMVYIGPWQVPTEVTLRTQNGKDIDAALGLETAYTPAFSPDGSKVCLIGSREFQGETAVWVFDADGRNCTEIVATRGLTPTYPVFSPDGTRVAFRNWALGDLWTVDLESEALTRYDLSVAEAPIAW